MLADKLLVLQYGVQQQFSSPYEVYWKPHNLFVAQYFGDNNLLFATPSSKNTHELMTALGSITITHNNSIPIGKELLLMCRPHQSVISSYENKDVLSWKMCLKKVSFFGAYWRLELYNQTRTWWVDVASSFVNQSSIPFVVGEDYWISVPPSSWVILHSY